MRKDEFPIVEKFAQDKVNDALNNVIEDINNLEEHDYCRYEGVNIPPTIDKAEVLAIIKKHLEVIRNE